MSLEVFLPSLLSLLLYLNSLCGELCYDDSRAIKKNPDVLGETSVWSLLKNDFWGTPLTHSGSHKSYRPLCTLTFRLNHNISGLNPIGFHSFNIILHCITTALYAKTIKKLMTSSRLTMLAGLMFASHPVHTEAVSGIVGRADVLSCFFFLLAFNFYISYCQTRQARQTRRKNNASIVCSLKECIRSQASSYMSNGNIDQHRLSSSNGHQPYGAHPAYSHSSKVTSTNDKYDNSSSNKNINNNNKSISDNNSNNICETKSTEEEKKRAAFNETAHQFMYIICTLFSMLSKEQGVTVVPVCFAYDIFLHQKLKFFQLFAFKRKNVNWTLIRSILLNMLTLLFMVTFRMLVIGMKFPEFSASDNPAADSDDLLTRTLTFLYLPVFNFMMLVYPWQLSFDWSMDAIQLIESYSDPRNILTLTFYSCLIFTLYYILKNVNVMNDRSLVSSCNGTQRHASPHEPTRHKTSHVTNDKNHFSNGAIKSSHLHNDAACKQRSPQSHPENSVDGQTRQRNHSNVSGCVTFCDVGHKTKIPVEQHVYFVMALSLLIFPYIPASNLFFYVGFVVAERVLYMPSLGYCLLFALIVEYLLLLVERTDDHKHRWSSVGENGCCKEEVFPKCHCGKDVKKSNPHNKRKKCSSAWRCFKKTFKNHLISFVNLLPQSNFNLKKMIIYAFVLTMLATFCVKTLKRNEDWLTEEALYRAGIQVNPAKAWGNLANVLNGQGRAEEAEKAYKTALLHRSNMADVHYNLGILYQEQKRYMEAKKSYEMAIQCRPKLTMAHLNLGIIMTTLGKFKEAEQVYRHCSEIDTYGLKDPRLHEQTKISALYNLGRLLADQERHQEAVVAYKQAIERKPSYYPAQSIYNMLGESYMKLQDEARAEFNYKQALLVKPDHVPAHLTLAKLMQKKGLLHEAEKLYRKAMFIDGKDYSVHQHYAQFLAETGRPVECASRYLEAVRLAPDEFEVVFNTANALRTVSRNVEAEYYYRRATELQPQVAMTHMNLGAMLHYNGKYEEAELSYMKALNLKPADQVTVNNLNKLRSLIKKKKDEL